MSIDDLAAVNVTSVSKTAQPLGDAAAAIYVISRDDILRSGALTLPDMLRLAPNLQVYETHPGSWVVTARGMNGNPAAQSFSNKLLVLVDGRSAYTPLFSGVYWDQIDVLPNDVDRIEVISGPGGTLWGANAMNGVINIITRNSSQGGIYAGFRGGGNARTAAVSARTSLTDNLSARISVRWLDLDSSDAAPGVSAGNGQHRLGGNIRLDWTPSDHDAVSLEGELYRGKVITSPTTSDKSSGHNVVLRWNHTAENRNELQVQLFYDHVEQFHIDTYDAEIQHMMMLGDRHRLLWGAGARVTHYNIGGGPSLFFDPDSRNLVLANGFIQDSFSPTPRLTLTAGVKLEKDPYVGVSVLPEFRIAWKPRSTTLIWAAISRAVRSPTPFDVDVQERAGVISLSGNAKFRTEKLTAYELGMRMQPTPTFSISINGYYNQYDDLRTIELLPGPGFNLRWGNNLRGHSYGLDAWAEWQPTTWWTLSGGVSWIKQKLHFAPGATGILGTTQNGTDPPYTFKLHSTMNFGSHVRLDAEFRAIGALRGSSVGAYQELGGRIAWLPSTHVVLSVSASNLLHKYHQEYPGGDLIPRRIMGGVELRF